jgi:hypothetical protein
MHLVIIMTFISEILHNLTVNAMELYKYIICFYALIAWNKTYVTLANTPTSISLQALKNTSTFVTLFENQVTGLNERRNMIGAHI